MSSPTPTPAPAVKPPDTRILVSKGAPLFGSLPPQWAALARGVLLAVIIAALGVVIQAIQTGAITLPPEYAWVGSLATLVYQALVGAVDSHSVGKTTAALAAKERQREAASGVSATSGHNGAVAIAGVAAIQTVPAAAVDPQPVQPPAAPKVTRPPRTPKPKAAASQPTVTPAPKPKTAKASAKGSPAPKPAKGGAK